MMRLMRACAVLVTALALMGAATAPRLAPGALARIKTVGIISGLGSTFMFEDTRTSPFEWLRPPRASFLEISDWGMDDVIGQTIAMAVSKRFAVKPVNFEPADFITWTYDDLIRHIRDFQDPDPDIDAYVVVLRDWRTAPIAGSNDTVAGFGLYRRNPGASAPRLGIFAFYRIVIIDAHDSRILASRAALLPDGSSPTMTADNSLWPKTQNDLTDAQRKILQSDITRLLAASLATTLRQMKLTD